MNDTILSDLFQKSIQNLNFYSIKILFTKRKNAILWRIMLHLNYFFNDQKSNSFTSSGYAELLRWFCVYIIIFSILKFMEYWERIIKKSGGES
jgi:hypothetical protein